MSKSFKAFGVTLILLASVILPACPIKLRSIDLTALDADAALARAEEIAREEAGELMDLGEAPLFRAGLLSVVVAIVVPEIPRVVRLVRAIVLSVREEPYVEAGIMAGTPTPLLLVRHILPNTIAPLIVQGTFICASAILIEAILSFLGVGIPPETPTWGNIMAEGRVQFVAYPHNVFFPGIFLAATVLAVNILGDGLRDTLDPKMAKRVEDGVP